MKRTLLAGLSLVCLILPVRAQSDAEKKATIAYLRDRQVKNSGFRANTGTKRADLRSTSAALRALKYFGGEPPDRAACIPFVQGCFDPRAGGFATEPGDTANFTSTCVGIMAVVELKMPTAAYADKVVHYLGTHARTFEEIRLGAAALESIGKQPPESTQWLEQIAKLRNADGTYGKGDGVARDTGGAVVAVLRLGGKVEHRQTVLKALNNGLRKDGGFGKEDAPASDLETTYRVMRAFHMFGVQPEGAEHIRSFIAQCRNEDGGYGVAAKQPSSVSGCYYAGIILHWLDAK
jgi:hypothetical protein